MARILGRPMIAWVAERAAAASAVDEVVVATDDERIADVCDSQGMRWLMTETGHETGTDRVAEVAARRAADVYVNVQGDEPLVVPDAIDAVVGCLLDGLPGIDLATAYATGTTAEEEASSSVVHLVPTLEGRILTLSRLPVPAGFREAPRRNVHLGLYAFTGDALVRFAGRAPGPVERAESIELLRFLEHGDRIGCVAVARGGPAVDHPEDVARVEAVLRSS